MARKPQNEMSFRPGKIAEGDEYVLNELYSEINALHAALGMDKGSDPKKQILELMMQNDTQQDQINELKAIQMINESAISKLQEAIQALAAKLDAEDVTNLDSDYLTNINTKLF